VEPGRARPGRGALNRFRCSACAYGASANSPPERCPICGGKQWEHEDWRPFGRLVSDLLAGRRARPAGTPAGGPSLDKRRSSALFRELNEQIRRLEVWDEEELDLVCECDDPGCFANVSIGVADYDRIRPDLELFVVLPGHEPPASDILEHSHAYLVVRSPARPLSELGAMTAFASHETET
jgi:hypothetical protein